MLFLSFETFKGSLKQPQENFSLSPSCWERKKGQELASTASFYTHFLPSANSQSLGLKEFPSAYPSPSPQLNRALSLAPSWTDPALVPNWTDTLPHATSAWVFSTP